MIGEKGLGTTDEELVASIEGHTPDYELYLVKLRKGCSDERDASSSASGQGSAKFISLRALYAAPITASKFLLIHRKAISFFTEHDQMCVTNNIYPAITIFVLVVLALM